ncbi:MAG TPA: hypothetical protein VGI39_13900 [Polyangiaceae bacterium]
MFANTKSSRLGFAAIVAVLAATLGGCAESTQGVSATSPAEERETSMLVRLGQPHPHYEDDLVKPEVRVAERVEKKHVATPAGTTSTAHLFSSVH